MNKPPSNLTRLRDEIDKLDREIVSLLDRRMSLSFKIGELKKSMGLGVLDREREDEIIERLLNQSLRFLGPYEIESIYSTILRVSRESIQMNRKGTQGKICITVMASRAKDARREMLNAAGKGDLVELRLDALEEIRLEELFPFEEVPVVVTNRRKEEGGVFRGSEEERLSYLEEAMSFGVGFVDVEWLSPEPLLSRTLKRKGDTKIILSYHDLNKTPPLEEMFSLWKEMSLPEADILKIVPFAGNIRDSLRVLRFLSELGEERKPIISHCMGPHGRASRILAPLVGSYMAYASCSFPGEGAPGQMTAYEMRRAWDVIDPRGAKSYSL